MIRAIPDFLFYSGDDIFTLPFMALGAHGVVSVVSNLIPDRIVELTNSCLEGDYTKSRKIHYELLPLFKNAFIETNPIPIKAAMDLCGMAAGKCRLPMTPMSAANEEILRQTLLTMGILCEELV